MLRLFFQSTEIFLHQSPLFLPLHPRHQSSIRHPVSPVPPRRPLSQYWSLLIGGPCPHSPHFRLRPMRDPAVPWIPPPLTQLAWALDQWLKVRRIRKRHQGIKHLCWPIASVPFYLSHCYALRSPDDVMKSVEHRKCAAFGWTKVLSDNLYTCRVILVHVHTHALEQTSL